VPPYGRAGLYKQLAVLRDLLAEYRGGGAAAGAALKGPIIDALNLAGLQQDCPYSGPDGGRAGAGGHPPRCCRCPQPPRHSPSPRTLNGLLRTLSCLPP
jgi:hypothetical protein